MPKGNIKFQNVQKKMPPKSAKLRHYSLSQQNSIKFCKKITRDRIFCTRTLFAHSEIFASHGPTYATFFSPYRPLWMLPSAQVLFSECEVNFLHIPFFYFLVGSDLYLPCGAMLCSLFLNTLEILFLFFFIPLQNIKILF